MVGTSAGSDCGVRAALGAAGVHAVQLSYNYVTTARLANGAPVVLKLGVPNPELSAEAAALRIFNGRSRGAIAGRRPW